MAAPGYFQFQEQRHQRFRRTAKELLSLRLIDANSQLRESSEIRRLEKEFQHQHITLLVRHPMHNVVADCKIPIIHSKDYSNFNRFNHPLTLYRVLPVSEYGRCEVTLQMPGWADVIVENEYECDEEGVTLKEPLEPTSVIEASTIRWPLVAASQDMYALKCAGFLHDGDFEDDNQISFCFSGTCAYPSSLDLRSMVDNYEYEALAQVLPTAVTEASISIFFTSPHDHSSRFWYLKLIENWMVVARHLSDNATELARLRSRFEETYLLVEVGFGHGADIAKCKMPEGRCEPCPPMASMLAFALVPLADEAALLAIFNSQSTQLQLVEREGRLERLSLTGSHVVNISVLDSRTNRVAKLGEGRFTRYSGQPPITKYVAKAKCAFESFEQIVVFIPRIQEEVNVTAAGVERAATVMLSVKVSKDDYFNPHFASILELWKFLEICMTGELQEH